MAIVSILVGDALGCGGRLEVADCGQGRQYCADTNVCCPDFTTCGNGTNGCPPGDCCLDTTSHIVDGGGSEGPTGTSLPPPVGGYYDPSDPDPGGVPGSAGGGGGGGGGVGSAGGQSGSVKHL
jgi:hypothetical protein